ncbi:hypothetical protein C8K44_13211 [Aminobacter sp. AP02]|nr:hypothetical protein C8K44_13211 [Aminobacter sp. AP02]
MRNNSKMSYLLMLGLAVAVVALFISGLAERAQEPAHTEQASVLNPN